jgi:hypothetical protein
VQNLSPQFLGYHHFSLTGFYQFNLGGEDSNTVWQYYHALSFDPIQIDTRDGQVYHTHFPGTSMVKTQARCS